MEAYRVSELEDWLTRYYPHIFDEWAEGPEEFMDLDEWMEALYPDELVDFETGEVGCP